MQEGLSKRERQIMDALYRLGRADAADIQRAIPEPPSHSAVRALLRILEDKGHVTHDRDGLKYLYAPVVNRQSARRSALRHLVKTFFDGSPADAAAALLDSGSKLKVEEIDRLQELIDKARKEGG
jgi:BlaI family transcriptional regulator, penicillinase repressor